MIDIKLLRENPDAVRASQRARGADESVVDQILELDSTRRSSLGEFEKVRAEQKQVSKSVGAAMGALNKAKKSGDDAEVAWTLEIDLVDLAHPRRPRRAPAFRHSRRSR